MLIVSDFHHLFFQLQDLAVSLLELWNLLDTLAEEQKIFHNVTCSIAVPESEITEANILSVASIKRVCPQEKPCCVSSL